MKPKAAPSAPLPQVIVYPESDGEPMSDNTKQYDWMVKIAENLRILFAACHDVLVAANLLWYAVEAFPKERAAPDVMVVFGTPKGHRGSYLQWLDGVAPQVIFELISHKSTDAQMLAKHAWYERYGVEEYYVYDPRNKHLEIHLRDGPLLRRRPDPHGFVSPRTGVRFDLSGPKLALIKPNGERFLTFLEMHEEMIASQRRADLYGKRRHGKATPQELAELDRLESEP
jgi:Uma2 family endonuclease